MISDEAKELLTDIEEWDGAEVHKDFWAVADELWAAGLINLTSARGPGQEWKRATLKEGNCD